ncbi:hypothetical protein [Vibrio alginolyticus]|uniref:hypothetical protein n=1 Tax=Vibrio alginolyticus TaxID=663 RepID=UPI0027E42B7D|nr:hypothetical protein [Vibrio alginolyticus]WMO21377.1 hypothetical protein NI375_24130 [Vibrio alginolyticus]WMO21566.1 hypothetical protein NI375_25215 [Vibrio alginolyticus]
MNQRENLKIRSGFLGVLFLGYAPGFIKGIVEQDLAIPQRGGYEFWLHIYGLPAVIISFICLVLCGLALKLIYKKTRNFDGWEAKLGIYLSFLIYLIGCMLQFTGNSFFPLFICMAISVHFVVLLMS